MKKLEGKVAIVTGASKGIGAGIAKAFAAAGATVVVNYATSKEGADAVVTAITNDGGKAVAVQADMAKPGDVERLVHDTKTTFGRLDVLVNNAGVYKFVPLAEVDEAEFHRQFDTNVLGPILAAKHAAAAFGPEGGSILNVGSVVSRKPMATSSIYTATKSALDTVTRVLARELGPRGIRVNSLNPGPVDTEGTRAGGIIGSDLERAAVAATPLGRSGLPDDIAKVAVFFASDDAHWVTGETLFVSGGFG